jgi:Histidine kinase-, DNA gyrase B-, and HSP90-like ATPase
MMHGQLRSTPPDAPASTEYAATSPRGSALWRRRIQHDIRHELGTINLLASVVATADDIGPTSRRRIEQLLGETRWIDHLLRQLDEDDPDDGYAIDPGDLVAPGDFLPPDDSLGPDDTVQPEAVVPPSGAAEPDDLVRPAGTRPAGMMRPAGIAGAARSGPAQRRVRVDELVAEIVRGIRLAGEHRVGFHPEPVSTHIDALALWRAIRNVLGNACRMAHDRVDVRIWSRPGEVVVEIDDDGPGFGPGPADRRSLGLGIVRDVVSRNGGRLEIHTNEVGGARVRVVVPAAPPETMTAVAGVTARAAAGVAGAAAGVAGAPAMENATSTTWWRD